MPVATRYLIRGWQLGFSAATIAGRDNLQGHQQDNITAGSREKMCLALLDDVGSTFISVAGITVRLSILMLTRTCKRLSVSLPVIPPRH